MVIGAVQVFAPELADGRWVAFATTPGRAIGNMRQPSQLSTLLLWAAAAAVWLSLRERRPIVPLALVLAALVFGVAMTASRTGLVGVVLLALWGPAGPPPAGAGARPAAGDGAVLCAVLGRTGAVAGLAWRDVLWRRPAQEDAAWRRQQLARAYLGQHYLGAGAGASWTGVGVRSLQLRPGR